MQVITRLLLFPFLVVALLLAGLVTAPQALAQTTTQAEDGTTTGEPKVIIDKRKLLVPPRNADGSIVTVDFLEDPVRWMSDRQQEFYGRIASALRAFRMQSSSAAGWTLFWLSFLYGVFHAAGPGHGKVVITGWILATEQELKRGLLIAFMSSLFQALTAIVAVSAILLFVKGASAMARDVASFLESASYAMVGLMGLYLAWGGWQNWRRASRKSAAPTALGVTPFVQGTVAVTARHRIEDKPFDLVSRPGENPQAGHDHVHDENCGCGHAHAPSAAEVKGKWSWQRAFALAFAVGIRPCSGALLVLIVSYTLGLYWVGVVATLAMGFGVFLTIGTIASLAVFAKSFALRFAGVEIPLTRFALLAGKMVIGLGIAGLGLLLFLGSLGSSNVMM